MTSRSSRARSRINAAVSGTLLRSHKTICSGLGIANGTRTPVVLICERISEISIAENLVDGALEHPAQIGGAAAGRHVAMRFEHAVQRFRAKPGSKYIHRIRAIEREADFALQRVPQPLEFNRRILLLAQPEHPDHVPECVKRRSARALVRFANRCADLAIELLRIDAAVRGKAREGFFAVQQHQSALAHCCNGIAPGAGQLGEYAGGVSLRRDRNRDSAGAQGGREKTAGAFANAPLVRALKLQEMRTTLRRLEQTIPRSRHDLNPCGAIAALYPCEVELIL